MTSSVPALCRPLTLTTDAASAESTPCWPLPLTGHHLLPAVGGGEMLGVLRSQHQVSKSVNRAISLNVLATD